MSTDRKVRVASLWTNLYGCGCGNRMLSFGQALDRSRFDLTVVALCRGDLAQEETFGSTRKFFHSSGIDLVALDEDPLDHGIIALDPASILRGAFGTARIVGRVIKLIIERDIDVIDAHGEAAIIIGLLAARTTRRRLVATSFGPEPWDRPGWRSVGQLAYRYADALVTDSNRVRDRLGAWLSSPPARLLMIPNGVPRPESSFTKAEMRRKLELPVEGEAIVVGQVSRLIPSKGHFVILDAAKKILARAPNTFFVFCGYLAPESPPDYIEQLYARAAEHGFRDKLRVVSYPGPIGDVWTAIDVHVHASMLDSSPIAIIEAMSLGKPSVVTRVGGIPDLVVNEETGLVIPENDPPALESALSRVLLDRDLAARFGRAAHERWTRNHKPEALARPLEDLFGELARA